MKNATVNMANWIDCRRAAVTGLPRCRRSCPNVFISAPAGLCSANTSRRRALSFEPPLLPVLPLPARNGCAGGPRTCQSPPPQDLHSPSPSATRESRGAEPDRDQYLGRASVVTHKGRHVADQAHVRGARRPKPRAVVAAGRAARAPQRRPGRAAPAGGRPPGRGRRLGGLPREALLLGGELERREAAGERLLRSGEAARDARRREELLGQALVALRRPASAVGRI
jgi:hypothetical protein